MEKIKKYSKQLLSNGFFKSVMSIGSGNLISQIMSLISVPILTRIYSNEAYGEYGVVASTVTIVASFAVLGLASAIMAPKETEESKKVFMTAFFVQLFVVAVVGVGAFAISPYYKLFTVTGSYYSAIVLFCIYIFSLNLNSILRVYVNKCGLNKVLLVNPIIGSICNFVIALPLGLLGVGYSGFLISYTISNMIANIQMIVRSKPFLKGYNFSDFKFIIKNYKDYIIYQCPANLVNNTSTQWPIQYMSRFYTGAQMSHYTVSCNLLQYPIRLIAAPIGTAYFKTATEYNREGKDLAEFTFRLVVISMLVALIPVLIFILWGDKICGFVLGEKWFETGKVASIVVLQYVLLFCVNCTSYCKVSLGRQRVELIYGIISLFVTAVAAFLAQKYFGTFMGVVFVCTGIRCLMNIFNVALCFYCLKKYLWRYIIFALSYFIVIFGIVLVKFL